MTEPNPAPAAAAAAEPLGTPIGTAAATPPGAAPAGVDWPALPAAAAGADPDVERLLGRLGTLPELPVSEHGEVYAGLHHDLKEALNEAGDTAP
jgi:hypothetical protein